MGFIDSGITNIDSLHLKRKLKSWWTTNIFCFHLKLLGYCCLWNFGYSKEKNVGCSQEYFSCFKSVNSMLVIRLMSLNSKWKTLMSNARLVIVNQLSQIYQLYSTCNDASCLTAWWERQCFSHPPSTNSSSGNLANWCSRPIPSWKTRRYYIEGCSVYGKTLTKD